MKTLVALSALVIATAAVAKPPIPELAACFSTEEEAPDFADRRMLHSHGNNI